MGPQPFKAGVPLSYCRMEQYHSVIRSLATTASSQKDSSRQKDAGRRAHEHQAIGPGLGERGVIA